MTLRYRFSIGCLAAILTLFFLSGQPLERGWPLFLWGLFAIPWTAFGYLIGYSFERDALNQDDDDNEQD